MEYVEKIHKAERTNPIDRAVAAQAMGYSGISGRSAKMLSDLIQYGLLDKAGKNEVRVSQRAVDILHPATAEAKRTALKAAAFEPELFQRIGERFPDGRPSDASLRSYFVREEFTDAAIPSAVRAYMETWEFLEQANVCESHGLLDANDGELHENQSFSGDDGMQSSERSRDAAQPRKSSHAPSVALAAGTGAKFNWDVDRIWLGGVVTTKKEAEKAIALLQALKEQLSDDSSAKSDISDSQSAAEAEKAPH